MLIVPGNSSTCGQNYVMLASPTSQDTAALNPGRAWRAPPTASMNGRAAPASVRFNALAVAAYLVCSDRVILVSAPAAPGVEVVITLAVLVSFVAVNMPVPPSPMFICASIFQPLLSIHDL